MPEFRYRSSADPRTPALAAALVPPGATGAWRLPTCASASAPGQPGPTRRPRAGSPAERAEQEVRLQLAIEHHKLARDLLPHTSGIVPLLDTKIVPEQIDQWPVRA